MPDASSYTESLLDVVRGIESRVIMLPEFQRDFRWELDQTNDLLDSLIRDIFIGTIIYGKPSFAMTLREIDLRPRRGKGSNLKIPTIDYSSDIIKQLASTQNLRIVLDGQQRITSIYRALTGSDPVFVILKDEFEEFIEPNVTLEAMLASVANDESSSQISVKVSDAYGCETKGLEDEELNKIFLESRFARSEDLDPEKTRIAQRVYRRAVRKLVELFKQQKMLAFYLLDMSVDKFCTFFERSAQTAPFRSRCRSKAISLPLHSDHAAARKRSGRRWKAITVFASIS